MSDLQVLYNKAARIILDLDYRSSASVMYYSSLYYIVVYILAGPY